MNAEYNDICKWEYTDVPATFGATKKQVKTFVVKTKDELERLLKDKDFIGSKGLQFVEVWMPKDDAPRGLKITTEISARNNARTEE